MIVLVVEDACLEAFGRMLARRLPPGTPVRVAHVGEVVDGKPPRDARLVWLGSSLWSASRSDALARICARQGYARMLNAPGPVRKLNRDPSVQKFPNPPGEPFRFGIELATHRWRSDIFNGSEAPEEALVELVLAGVQPAQIRLLPAEDPLTSELAHGALLARRGALTWGPDLPPARVPLDALPSEVLAAYRASGFDVLAAEWIVSRGEIGALRLDDRPFAMLAPQFGDVDLLPDWFADLVD